MKACLFGVALLVVGLAATTAGAQSKRACPVSGKAVTDISKAPMIQINRKRTYFCCEKCVTAFRQKPEKYLKEVANCPILENPVAKIGAANRVVLNNNLYYLCCEGCTSGFLKAPDHLKKQPDVVTGELFLAGSESPHMEYKGQHYLFATAQTKATFEKNPAKYVKLYGK